MNNFVKYLKKRSQGSDQKLFREYMNKKIELPETIERFRKNNNIDECVIINESEFIVWMSSLGYRRSSYENK